MKRNITKKQRIAGFLSAGEKLLNGYRYKEAIAEWRKAAALEKDHPGTAELIAKAENIIGWIGKLREQAANFRNKGERLRAAMMYAEILKLDPTLSDIALEAGKLKEELNGINAHIEAGEKLFSKHEYGGAIAEWKEALRTDKENSEALFLIKKANDVIARAEELEGKARGYRRAGQLDPAARTYEELLRLFPNLAGARKELDEVNAEIRRANSLKPRHHEERGKAQDQSESPAAGTKTSGLKPDQDRTGQSYIFPAMLLLILTPLFPLLSLMLTAKSSSPLFGVYAAMTFGLLPLLFALLFAFFA